MLFYLFVTLMAVVVVGYFFYFYSYKTLEKEEFAKLRGLQEIRKEQLKTFFQEKVKDIKSIAVLDFTSHILNDLTGHFKAAEDAGYNGIRILEYTPYKNSYNLYYNDLEHIASLFDLHDIFFFSPSKGNLIFSLQLEKDFGTNMSMASTHLSRAWQRVKREKETVITDLARYFPTGNAPTIFILAPVISKGKYIGAIGGLLSNEVIDRIMQERIGLGRTGQKYLVGEDLLLRAQSSGSDADILVTKIDTPSVHNALDKKNDTWLTTDHKGKKVLCAYSPVGMRDIPGANFEWVILTQTEVQEAMEPAFLLGKKIILISFLFLAIAGVFSYYLSYNITRPITQIAQYVLNVASKNIESDLSLKRKRKDEIGKLGEAVICMSRNLREQIREITEGINVLAGSGTEISAATSQYASNSSQIATAVRETAVSIRELKQTSELANEKAAFVAERSREVMQTSQKGRESVEATTEAMQAIREQMTSIAESIVSLNEKTKSINDIIAVVEDIADESRLLAVNAAIEAVKAGEYGKGFSVVAAEIKNLAEQSKKSTGQVRNLLTSIQEAAATAVMATEKGGKVVENGMKQASLSGESIHVLTRSISDSSQAAIQIETTGKQQLAGIDQVFEAIENIDTAIAQNAGGAEQLKNSTQDLEDLGKRLQHLIEDYKL